MAPRNQPNHRANEPAESHGDQMVQDLARHKQPEQALGKANEEESKNKKEIPSFVYTSAHVRDLE